MNDLAESDIDTLEDRFNSDSSAPYGMTETELLALLGRVGEQEPVIDALLLNSGVSKRVRARAIGVQESDFL